MRRVVVLKSDKEFIEAMWRQVYMFEQEVTEREKARISSRKLVKRNVLISGILLLAALAVLLCINLIGTGALYLIALIIMGIAYISETYITSRS
jgi:F0F1-type ATP synthase assembly protein I